MIRGLKIYSLLLLHDLWRTFLVTPKGIVSLLGGIFFSVVFLPLMMIAEHEQQSKAIYHGLSVGGPRFIRRRLFSLLDKREQRTCPFDSPTRKGPT